MEVFAHRHIEKRGKQRELPSGRQTFFYSTPPFRYDVKLYLLLRMKPVFTYAKYADMCTKDLYHKPDVTHLQNTKKTYIPHLE